MVPTLSAHHLSRGTLKIPGNKEYFAHQIGLTDVPVKTIPAFYDYSKQTRLYVIKKGLSIQQASAAEYADYLVEALVRFCLTIRNQRLCCLRRTKL